MAGFFEPLKGFEVRKMPARKPSFWKLAGPGAILVGLSIGAGEIVIWPRIVAEYGASMVWAACLGIFLQLWINFEVGRWTVATGETVYTGYSRVWARIRSRIHSDDDIQLDRAGVGRASGLALKALLVGPHGWGSDTFWTVITFGGSGPDSVRAEAHLPVRRAEHRAARGDCDNRSDRGRVRGRVGGDLDVAGEGVVNVGYIDPGMSVKAMFIALVFAGAGGTANLFYTFYLRDKHIGMGAHLPEMQNPLRGRTEAMPSTGFRFEETEENIGHFRRWFDYVKKDQMLFFWALNSVTILLFIFGALAVLHPNGIVPAGGTLIWDEAEVLATVWGETGRYVFLVVGLPPCSAHSSRWSTGCRGPLRTWCTQISEGEEAGIELVVPGRGGDVDRGRLRHYLRDGSPRSERTGIPLQRRLYRRIRDGDLYPPHALYQPSPPAGGGPPRLGVHPHDGDCIARLHCIRRGLPALGIRVDMRVTCDR